MNKPREIQHRVTDDEPIEDDWTEEEVLEAGKRIIERLGIEGQLSDANT